MSRLTIKHIFNSYPVRLILFLELTFILFRVLFIALVFLKGKTIDTLDIPNLFIYALRLDLAAISYIAALPILIWIIYQYTNSRFLLKIKNTIIVFFLPIVTIILFSNLSIFLHTNKLRIRFNCNKLSAAETFVNFLNVMIC